MQTRSAEQDSTSKPARSTYRFSRIADSKFVALRRKQGISADEAWSALWVEGRVVAEAGIGAVHVIDTRSRCFRVCLFANMGTALIRGQHRACVVSFAGLNVQASTVFFGLDADGAEFTIGLEISWLVCDQVAAADLARQLVEIVIECVKAAGKHCLSTRALGHGLQDSV